MTSIPLKLESIEEKELCLTSLSPIKNLTYKKLSTSIYEKEQMQATVPIYIYMVVGQV